jgi:CDP-diacylglycerol--glycerol-3-phosphate 3-phosphatidyltransferase
VGLTANSVTVIGAFGVTAASLALFPNGQFLLATLLITFFALSDLLDGTMARISKSVDSKWGAFLDSTLDRISDAAILIGIWIYFRNSDGFEGPLLIINLILGGLIPYIRARAEALSIQCEVGIAERVERLVIILVGTGLYGFGIEIALSGALYLLGILSLITVFQRVRVVYRVGR